MLVPGIEVLMFSYSDSVMENLYISIFLHAHILIKTRNVTLKQETLHFLTIAMICFMLASL